MFDADTVALIARAPVLEGLDLAALPQRLTDAYASIVAARIRIRRTANTPPRDPGSHCADGSRDEEASLRS